MVALINDLLTYLLNLQPHSGYGTLILLQLFIDQFVSLFYIINRAIELMR